ncbi:MAG TPA: sulfotransferase [Acidimicrobiia bacterium]|nr:sulfotransferase [Acidimicrobiia bacterium]
MNEPLDRDELSVIFLMGFRQSGTTILSSVLGSIDGFTDLGEVHNIWGQRGRGWPKCGCELRIDECPFWGDIVGEVVSEGGDSSLVGLHDADPRAMERLRTDWVRHWRRSRLVVGSRIRPGDEIAERYLGSIGPLYKRAAAKNGSVLIDSSKDPAFAAALDQIPGITSHLVHVVRDPRAAFWSRVRKSHGGSGDDSSLLAARFAGSWMRTNSLSELAMKRHQSGRTTRVRYEDFVANPTDVLLDISVMAGVDPGALPIHNSTTAILRPNHTASGNARVRFRSGPVELKLDDEWRRQLDRKGRRVVTALTAPLLLRYGYPLAP